MTDIAPNPHPKRRLNRRMLFAAIAVAVIITAALCFPIHETTYEFDAFNLRSRACSRYRSALFGSILHERCGQPTDHPTAAALRDLGVLPPVQASDSNWVLIKGFKPGVRGWHGSGKYYLELLGGTTFGTPVPFPTAEDLSRNVWVKWARRDRDAARRFWANFQATKANTHHGADYLYLARTYLREHDPSINLADLEAFAAQARTD